MSAPRWFAVSLCVLVAVGCTPTITRARYDSDVRELNDQVSALERRNAQIESELAGFKKIAREAELVAKENEFYDKTSRLIEEWMKTNRVDSADVHFDPKTGKWTIQDAVLFESGSYAISTKGREILGTIAKAYADKSIGLRVVGHTDRDPIGRSKTKQSLPVSHGLQLELSALRAVAVAFELKKAGIPEKRMFVEGHGNNNPVAANDNSAENKKKNRRVEIFVVQETSGK